MAICEVVTVFYNLAFREICLPVSKLLCSESYIRKISKSYLNLLTIIKTVRVDHSIRFMISVIFRIMLIMMVF